MEDRIPLEKTSKKRLRNADTADRRVGHVKERVHKSLIYALMHEMSATLFALE